MKKKANVIFNANQTIPNPRDFFTCFGLSNIFWMSLKVISAPFSLPPSVNIRGYRSNFVKKSAFTWHKK